MLRPLRASAGCGENGAQARSVSMSLQELDRRQVSAPAPVLSG